MFSTHGILVVGGGIAGQAVCEAVRARDPHVPLTLVCAEDRLPYDRVRLGDLLADEPDLEALTLRPTTWYADHDVTVLLGRRVTALDPDAGLATLDDGTLLHPDRTVLCTGSDALVPPIPGAERALLFRDPADCAAMVRAAGPDVRAAVVGGGLLGLEAADALDQLDIDCTVVERGAWLGHSELDRRSGALLAEQLEGRGIDVVAGTSVRAIGGDARAEGVELSGGRTLTADVVIVCAGITPNAELARDAGLAVGRGVAVDASMRTSDPAVFACGDVAEVDGIVSGRWPAAVAQGEIAAVTALGGERTYDARPIPTRLKVTGLELTAIGRQEARPGDEVIVHEAEGSYRRLVLTRDRLRGAVAFGPAPGLDAVVAAVREGRHVTTLLDDLRAGDWTVLDRRSTGPAAARRAA
jgi:NAD(P)H-nitrite reductase large subunit